MVIQPKYYNTIDSFRLIASFFIVILHVRYADLNLNFISYLRLSARWAVPFFFVVSGYFFASKINYSGKSYNLSSLKNIIVKMISIIIITTSIYYIINIISQNYEIKSGVLILGNYFHLWYPAALLIGFLFIWYLSTYDNYKFTILICTTILMYCLISDSYDVLLFNINIDYILGRTLSAIPFIFMGFYIYKNNISYNKFIGVLLIFGFILQYLEVEFLYVFFNYSKHDHQLLIGTILFVYSLFLFCLNSKILKGNIAKLGKDHSLFIYLYHPFVYFFIENLIFKKYSLKQIEYFSPIVVFALTIFCSIIIKKKLNNLHNFLSGNFMIN